MSEQPGMIDESFDNVVPSELPSPVDVVADYLSHDPTKDWTPAQIKAVHATGRGCLMLWETNAGRALTGAPGGGPDARDSATELDSLIHGVGYAPKNKLGICAAVDQDITTQMGTVVAYFQAFHAGLAGRYLLGDYGEFDVVNSLAAICEFAFQASAWSGTRLSPNADAWQYLNGQRISGGTVDYDRLIHPERMGIWWPPGHALDTQSATPIGGTSNPEDDDPMANYTPDQLGDAFANSLLTSLVTRPDGKKVSFGSALGAIQQYIQSDYQEDQNQTSLDGQILSAIKAD